MYGWRAKFGLLIPSVNTCSEPQFAVMKPEGTAFYSTRLRLRGEDRRELLSMADHVEAAAQLLADLCPDFIMFHCTAGSLVGGAGYDQQIVSRIEHAAGCPAGTTATGVVAALTALSCRKIALLSPYSSSMNEIEAAFLQSHGFEIVSNTALDLGGGDAYPRVAPEEWYRRARSALGKGEECIFLSCTNIRVIEIVQRLEDDFGVPVVTSNQSALWYMLRRAGIHDSIHGFGRLLSDFAKVPEELPCPES